MAIPPHLVDRLVQQPASRGRTRARGSFGSNGGTEGARSRVRCTARPSGAIARHRADRAFAGTCTIAVRSNWARDPALPIAKPTNDRAVAIGDTVRVRYLNGDCKILRLTISKSKSDLGSGLVHFDAPIAKALLGAEEGDEVEVLTGPYVRPAVVESITKNGT
ncbi:hypothetical protein G6N73_26160 [Mesorhizobium camelthorni]|uniref:Transcription elongation factor GreA/GreB C-terminal domain-containing protein n=1 Tax=Allomesorhizobium camelthorni TaxID=475069 RepID=A0A6G4WK15_9HYPH|nr:hypothetical protein [Mesorhizobium camelthorni]